MRLTEKDEREFKQLTQSPTGKWLFDYLRRLKLELGDLEELTEENFKSRKEAFQIIEKHLLENMRPPKNQIKNVDNTQYV